MVSSSREIVPLLPKAPLRVKLRSFFSTSLPEALFEFRIASPSWAKRSVKVEPGPSSVISAPFTFTSAPAKAKKEPFLTL